MQSKTIFLVRHGDDLPNGNLSSKGIEQINETAKLIKQELLVKEIVIYHSPRKRAVESAKIIQQNLAPISVVLEPRDELSLGNYQVESVAAIATSPCIIVSHQPDLEAFYKKQTGKFIEIKEGTYVKLELK